MRARAKCPTKGREYILDLPSTATAVAHYWRRTIATDCPHCGQIHLEGFKQLYVETIFDHRIAPMR
jgi:hypothetical protein